MKRKTLSAILLTTALVASGCGSSVKTKTEDGKYVLFTIDGTNYYVDDLLGADSDKLGLSFLDTTTGVQAAYTAIWNAVVQAAQPVTTTIQNSADLAYEEWEDNTVATYVTQYGVTTKQAIAALLEKEGYDSTAEKKAALLLAEQKTALTKSFKKNKIEPSLSSLTGESVLEQYISNANPMIVNHILIKIASSNNVYSKATLTVDESEKLGTVCNKLALSKNSSNKFSVLAAKHSDDGSYANGGSLGVMDSYTNYVNEFKYGVYTAEAVLNHSSSNFRASLYGLSDESSSLLFGNSGIYSNYSVGKISVNEVCSTLVNKSEDIGAQEEGAEDEDANLYVRNIYFNKYFNTPAVQFLTYTDGASETDYPTADRSLNSDNIVTDESGNPILVVRSSYGIHFITVSYDAALKSAAQNATYFSYLNTSSDITADNNYVKNASYLGYDSLSDAQTARSTEIADRVLNYIESGYVSLTASENYLNYQMFDTYLASTGLVIPNTTIKNAVLNYVSNLQSALSDTIEVYENENWLDYVYQLQYDADMRSYLYK